MVVLGNVKFQILAQDPTDHERYDPLPEYDDPDFDPEENISLVIKYVEAKTDRKFQLLYTLLPGFILHGGDAIDLSYNIDGGTIKRTKTVVAKRMKIRDERIVSPEVRNIKSAKVKSSDIQQLITFAFGEASLDDQIIEQSGDQRNKGQGAVTLDARRVKLLDKKPEKTHSPIKTTKLLTKKSIVQGVSHTLKIGSSEAIEVSPSSLSWKTSPLPGEHGKRIEVEFRYRSRKTLQQIGCIPNEPELARPSREETQDVIQRLQQQLDRQASEILQLKSIKRERNLMSVSPAPHGCGPPTSGVIDLTSSPPPPSTRVKLENTIKRERPSTGEDNAEDSELEVVRTGKRAPREPPEVVELD